MTDLHVDTSAPQRLGPTLIEHARIVGPAHLRSFDAIHLAAAIMVGRRRS